MKYKVILSNTSSAAAVDTAGNFTFYKLNAAIECSQAWANLSASFEAYLYDGTSWRYYS